MMVLHACITGVFLSIILVGSESKWRFLYAFGLLVFIGITLFAHTWWGV